MKLIRFQKNAVPVFKIDLKNSVLLVRLFYGDPLYLHLLLIKMENNDNIKRSRFFPTE